MRYELPITKFAQNITSGTIETNEEGHYEVTLSHRRPVGGLQTTLSVMTVIKGSDSVKAEIGRIMADSVEEDVSAATIRFAKLFAKYAVLSGNNYRLCEFRQTPEGRVFLTGSLFGENYPVYCGRED